MKKHHPNAFVNVNKKIVYLLKLIKINIMDITKIQDEDCHWYWIPNRLLCEFKKELEELSGFEYLDKVDEFDSFIEKYEKYRTYGDKDLVPDFFNK